MLPFEDRLLSPLDYELLVGASYGSDVTVSEVIVTSCAGGRVSLPTSPGGEGLFGWAGAAGTIGFVHRKLGYRVGGYTQIMPSETVPFQAKFGETVLKDVTA